jgi:hypothetical protein
MNATPGGDDEQLLALLTQALEEQDQVPPDAVRAAKDAWTWRTIDAELAALTYDSLLDDRALTGVRGAVTVRALAFEAGEVTIELEVTEHSGSRRLVGQLVPAGAPAVRLEFADQGPPVIMLTDELGRFGAESLAPALVRLRIEDPAENAMPWVTEWVPL